VPAIDTAVLDNMLLAFVVLAWINSGGGLVRQSRAGRALLDLRRPSRALFVALLQGVIGAATLKVAVDLQRPGLGAAAVSLIVFALPEMLRSRARIYERGVAVGPWSFYPWERIAAYDMDARSRRLKNSLTLTVRTVPFLPVLSPVSLLCPKRHRDLMARLLIYHVGNRSVAHRPGQPRPHAAGASARPHGREHDANGHTVPHHNTAAPPTPHLLESAGSASPGES